MAGVQRPVRVAVHTRASCWVSLVAVPHRRAVPPGPCCWLRPPLLCCFVLSSCLFLIFFVTLMKELATAGPCNLFRQPKFYDANNIASLELDANCCKCIHGF